VTPPASVLFFGLALRLSGVRGQIGLRELS
jgi:hypothetical protein